MLNGAPPATDMTAAIRLQQTLDAVAKQLRSLPQQMKLSLTVSETALLAYMHVLRHTMLLVGQFLLMLIGARSFDLTRRPFLLFCFVGFSLVVHRRIG